MSNQKKGANPKNWKFMTAIAVIIVVAIAAIVTAIWSSAKDKESAPEQSPTAASAQQVEIAETPAQGTAAPLNPTATPSEASEATPAATPTAERTAVTDNNILPAEFPLPEGLTASSVSDEGTTTRVHFTPENMEDVVKFYNTSFREDTSSTPYYVSGYQGAPDNSGARYMLEGPGLKPGSKLVMRGDTMYLDIMK